MALTRITKGVIKPNENYDTHNINSTGIVTAIGLDVNGNGDISGDLNVGGVLTYEDVTSIDSVGIITAQKDIHVGGGVSAVGVGTFGSLDISGDIDVDGHTNLDNVSIAGVTTHNEDVWFKGATSGRDAYWDKSADTLKFAENAKLRFGNNDELRIDHRGYSYILNIDSSPLVIGSDTLQLTNAGTTSNYLYCSPGGTVLLYKSGNEKFRTLDNGIQVTGTTDTDSLLVSGISTFTGAIDANGDLDVDGHTNLDNVSISGMTTTNQINISSSGPRLTFSDSNENPDFYIEVNATQFVIQDATANAQRFRIQSNGVVDINGNTNFGGGIDVTGGPITATGDLDVDGHTNLDNVSIAGVTTITGSGNALEIVGGLVRCRNTASARFVANNGSAEGYFGWSSGVLTVGQAAATLSLEATGSNPIQFKTNSNVRLSIASDGKVLMDNTTGTFTIGGDNVYDSAKINLMIGSLSQTSATTEATAIVIHDQNSRRNGTEGAGSWKSKIVFRSTQINGNTQSEGASIVHDITYNNYSSTKMRSDLVFKTRGDAQTAPSDAATEKLRITSAGNVLINGSTFYGTGSNSLQVHDSTLVLSKVGTGTRNWRFVNNNLVAGNLGLQVSNADNGSTTYVDRIEIDKDGKVCIGNPATDPIANLEVHDANPVLYVRDSAGTSVDNDAKIGFGNASHYPVAYLSHIWDGTSGSLTAHTRSGGNEALALTIDAAQKIRTRGATNIGHGGMVYIQGYSDPIADETHSNLSVRGEGGNGFACGTYEATGNYASWIQAGYLPNFTGTAPAAIYPLVLNPNGAPVCIGNKNDASTYDAGLLRLQTVTGSSYTYQKWGLSLEHFNSSDVREQKFTFINESSQGTQSKANSIFRQYAVPYNGGTTYVTYTDQIVYAHRPGYNQYSWYKFNVHVTSSSRGGSARIGITWSSRHAGPGAYGEYSFAWTDEHHTSRANVFCRKEHFLSSGGASHGPYNWTSTPNVTAYSSTGGGSNGGFYLRVEGHVDANSSSYDGGVMHHFDIIHNDNSTGGNNTFFEFVSNDSGGPSEASSALSFN